MDKDRVEGSIKQATGAIKKGAGQLLGDQKLKTEGAAERASGKIQNAVGGLKDSLKESTEK